MRASISGLFLILTKALEQWEKLSNKIPFYMHKVGDTLKKNLTIWILQIPSNRRRLVLGLPVVSGQKGAQGDQEGLEKQVLLLGQWVFVSWCELSSSVQ